MIKRRIKNLIFGEHRVRVVALLGLAVIMVVLYYYQHREVSLPLPSSTTLFHYPMTHPMVLPFHASEG